MLSKSSGIRYFYERHLNNRFEWKEVNRFFLQYIHPRFANNLYGRFNDANSSVVWREGNRILYVLLDETDDD